jgi:deazaflavin-dependent oxidoreductase (nitroreductase family)
MSTSIPPDFNAQIIDEFRANHGRVGGRFEGTPLLLLHHTGARSGKSYVSPLAYQGDGGRYVIFASKGGAPQNPGWFHNLKARPETTIEVDDETVAVRAEEAAGEERERLFRTQVERIPQFGEYEQRAGRTIPVIVLTPAAGGPS